MNLHTLLALPLAATFFALSVSAYVAQNDSGVKQSMKNAGTESKEAVQDAGHGVKQGTKKAYHKTRRATKKAGHKVKDEINKPR